MCIKGAVLRTKAKNCYLGKKAFAWSEVRLTSTRPMFNPKPKGDMQYRIPLQCIWLKINGSWPFKYMPDKAFNNWHSLYGLLYSVWSWYVICAVGITTGFETAFLIDNLGDIMMTTENCCTTFMGVLNFIRLLHMRLNQGLFRQVIQQFVDDIWIVKQLHPDVAAKCSENMRIFRIMTALLSCLILMYCCMPLFNLFFVVGLNAEEKPFPYKMLFPFNAHHGWRYVATYIFTSYAGVCAITTLFAEDSIFGFFITYTCGQFQILHERIENLAIDAYRLIRDKQNDNEIQGMYLTLLNKIANDHNKLIEFGNRLEHFFSPILLVNFTISSILICMVGFQLVTGKDMFIGDYLKFLVYISSSLSQLYVLCWNGNTLIQYSTQTAQHLYGCNWEGETVNSSSAITKDQKSNKTINSKSNKLRPHIKCAQELHNLRNMQYLPANKQFRQNLQIMIMCSQRPVKITALKFSTLSLQSFTAILSTSMSYFTLLRTVFDENKDK